MTPLIPTEHELHAYVDDRLDPVRRAQVHAWLAANPQESARVEAWRNDARRLRAALAGFGQNTSATDLDLGQLRRRLRQRRQRQWASAALLLLALGVGGFGGWQAREATLVADTLPMADAVQAHRLFAGGPRWMSRPATRSTCRPGSSATSTALGSCRILVPMGSNRWGPGC